jgi:hypothetical protein
MTEVIEERLRRTILQVVEQQIRDNEPPATRQTYARLLGEGFVEQEAKKLIGYVVAAEVFGVLREGRRYSEREFTAKLQALPRPPWEGAKAPDAKTDSSDS